MYLFTFDDTLKSYIKSFKMEFFNQYKVMNTVYLKKHILKILIQNYIFLHKQASQNLSHPFQKRGQIPENRVKCRLCCQMSILGLLKEKIAKNTEYFALTFNYIVSVIQKFSLFSKP